MDGATAQATDGGTPSLHREGGTPPPTKRRDAVVTIAKAGRLRHTRRRDAVVTEHPVNPVDFFCQLWQIINLYFAKIWLCEVVLADYRLYFAKIWLCEVVLADYSLYFAKTWLCEVVLADYSAIFSQDVFSG
jgi:hypothetical protein